MGEEIWKYVNDPSHFLGLIMSIQAMFCMVVLLAIMS